MKYEMEGDVHMLYHIHTFFGRNRKYTKQTINSTSNKEYVL
jgi:hypothetical protein